MIFYTALWHALLLPRAVSDADGAYLSFTDTPRTVQYTHPVDAAHPGSQQAQQQQATANTLSFGTYYDDFSMWDIFRAQVPLLHLLLPSGTIRDLLASLTVKAQQGHWLPIFPAWNSYTGEMVGDHCGVWVADAVMKGAISPTDPVIVGKKSDTSAAADTDTVVDGNAHGGALYYMLKNALMVPHSDYVYRQSRGRRALDSTLQYGYIPLEDQVLASPHPKQQVSRTLEYAYDDQVLLQLLRVLRRQDTARLHSLDWAALLASGVNKVPLLRDVDANTPSDVIIDAIVAHLSNSSANYRNVLDSAGVGFVRGRHANGSWAETDSSFDPAVYYTWLTETNVWQYTWFVPHNVEDMIALYGGNDAFLAKLNTFFDEGWYNHGNEPDHHAAFLAAYATPSGHNNQSVGGAWQVQQRVHNIIKSQYLASERGLPVSATCCLILCLFPYFFAPLLVLVIGAVIICILFALITVGVWQGNEDAGQMSAWLVMAGLGVYQVCPGCGSGCGSEGQLGLQEGGAEYVLTTPLFDDVTVKLAARGDAPSRTYCTCSLYYGKFALQH
jgi:putative alpha-1,2-mannosidase